MDGFKDSTKMKYMMGGDVSAYKSGGTVKKAMCGGSMKAPMKKAMGGAAMKPVDKDKNPGLSKLPADVRNKMGYMKKGGVAEKAMGGACSPMKKATGGTVKMSEGGTYNEKGKRATMAEIAAEDRRMANRKPPAEGVSSRPTDSSGRRATDADLGMTRAKGMGAMSNREMEMMKAAAAKKGVPAHSNRPLIRRKTGGLSVMPKGKC